MGLVRGIVDEPRPLKRIKVRKQDGRVVGRVAALVPQGPPALPARARIVAHSSGGVWYES